MANEKNLTPFTSEQSREEAVKNGKKGGLASGASKRRRKAMRQTVNALLGAGLEGGESEFVEKLRARLAAVGADTEDATYQDALLASILLKAMKGDVRAAEFIRDIAGDNPHLEIKKQELKLRKEELRLKQAREAERPEGQTATDKASPPSIDLSKVTDEELAILDEITGKITAE